MQRRSLAIVFAAVSLLMLAGPDRATGQPADRVLHVAIAVDPHALNPVLAANATESRVAGLMFSSLVEFDSTNTPQPDLAATIPTKANGGISPDGRTITFHLRRGVKWHDGADFTADDVRFTIRTILDPKNNVPNRANYAAIARVDAPDALTVRFHLTHPQGFFLSEVASGYAILPAHLLAHSTDLAHDPFNAAPVGTGPYRFLRWQRGDRVELVANPGYFRGAPLIQRVDVMIVADANTESVLLRQHAIDLAAVESSQFGQLRTVADLAHTIGPANDVNALVLNVERPITGDRIVRRAIAKAIDRKRIVQTVSFGTGIPAYGDLPLFMYDGHPPAGWDDADPAGARALLESDGWKLGPDGVRVKNGVPLRLTYIAYSGSVSLASLDVQLIQMLRDVGIDTEYKTYSPALYFAPANEGSPLGAGAFDIAAISFLGGNEPGNGYIYRCASRSPKGFNLARYCNPEMDRLQDAVATEYDPARRRLIVQRIEDLAVADAPYAFLYHTPLRVIYNPALVPTPPALGNEWYRLDRWSFTSAP